jgi:hypothetical protein
MRHETRLEGRVSADGRRIESLEIDNTFWYEHLDGRDMVARTIVKARDLPLRPGRPGELVARVTGAELKRTLTEVRWLHSHWGNRGLEYFEPEPSFDITFAKAPGSGPVVLQGRVTTPDAFSWKPGIPTLPLVGVPVRVVKDGRVLASAFTDDAGSYELKAPAGAKVSLKVELQHAASGQALFAVVHDADTEPVWMTTAPFAPKSPGKDAAGAELPMKVDVSFAPAKDAASDRRYERHLADAAFAYVSTGLAWKEAKRLGLTLDLGLPLEVRVFSSESVGAPVPMTTGETVDPMITLPPEYSRREGRLRGPLVWHEFGHYVMADTFSNLYPRDPAGKFHEGYKNPSTTDSWTEGFASFFALLVNVHQMRSRRPVVDVNGTPYDFSVAWAMPWSQDDGVSQEEGAVASLLWDLVDAEENELVLEASNDSLKNQSVSLESLLIDEKPPQRFRDRVSVDAVALFAILTGTAAAADAPAAAPSGYGHVFDVRQLHAALRARGVGAQKAEGAPLDALDELFAGHGFFADVSPTNLYWDEGETVGLTANGARLWAGPLEIPPRPERRYTPVIPNSYVEYEVRESGGEALPARRFRVDVRYAPPNESHDYSFDAWASDPGRLYVVCPNPTIAVSYRIQPVVDGAEATSALDLGCDRYWAEKRKGPRGSFLRHTFEVERPRGVARLLPSSGGSLLPLLAALAVAALGGAALLAGGALLLLKRRSAPGPAAPSADPLSVTAWWLDVTLPDGAAVRVDLVPGTLTIGRAADNGLVLPQADVSGHHAALDLADGRLVLRDLGSSNGTFVDDVPIGSVELAAGDLFRIGANWLRVGAE